MRDGYVNIDVNITSGHAYFFVFYWFRILGFLGLETLTSCESLSEYVHYLRNLKSYIH